MTIEIYWYMELIKMQRQGRFIEASLLCLLMEEDNHGYGLLEKLVNYKLVETTINIGMIYRALRTMEKNNLVDSKWEESEQGPKKRLYTLSSLGREKLSEWIDFLHYRRERIETIINLYDDLKKQE